MFLYILPSDTTANFSIPKSIPMPSLAGISTLSGYSMQTEIHQCIPSKDILGFIYLISFP